MFVEEAFMFVGGGDHVCGRRDSFLWEVGTMFLGGGVLYAWRMPKHEIKSCFQKISWLVRSPLTGYSGLRLGLSDSVCKLVAVYNLFRMYD